MVRLARDHGWVFLKRTWRAILAMLSHNALELAGFVAYTMIFALFPFIIFLVALAGFLGNQDAADKLVGMLFDALPHDIAATLAPAIQQVLTSRHGGVLTFGIILTLWSASSGIEALRLSLNRAYRSPEMRPFWKRRLQSLVFVVFSAIAMLAVSVLVVALPSLISIAASYLPLTEASKAKISISGTMVGVVIVFGGLAALHYWLPQRKMKIRELWPGVVFSGLLIVALGGSFGVYLSLIGNESVTYGGLGGVILTLLFFYMGGVLFSFGAEFNAAAKGFVGKERPRINSLDQDDGLAGVTTPDIPI